MKEIHVCIKAETKKRRQLIKKCHACGKIIESYVEVDRCPGCNKRFLPINYFNRITQHKGNEQDIPVSLDRQLGLYASSDELREEDLICGIHVLW